MDESDLLLSSIKALGLKVTDHVYDFNRVSMWKVPDISYMKDATQMYNLYVDENMCDYTWCRYDGGWNDCYVNNDKILLEQFVLS